MEGADVSVTARQVIMIDGARCRDTERREEELSLSLSGAMYI